MKQLLLQNKIKLNKQNSIYFFIAVLALIYIILKAFSRGNDINVYLQASTQLFNHKDIYSNNTYGDYLYSPMFAVLLRPLSILDFRIARVIWAILNIVITIRLWAILSSCFKIVFDGNKKLYYWWKVGVIFISFNFLNQNLILGQITILILWLTFEGLHQLYYGNKILGAALLALGINIKIIPVITLFYLIFKRNLKPVLMTIIFLLATIFIPSIYVGENYNSNLLVSWENKINPSGDKYVFEDNDGNNSINTMLPAYFFRYKDFKESKSFEESKKIGFDRHLAYAKYGSLLTIMQITRIFLLLSIFILIFY